jgi:Glucosyl transferase GtrII
MSSLLSTPLETTLANGWRRIDPASRAAFFVALCVSVLAFGFEMTNLSLHHDDLIQIFIEDTILGHYLGRFGVGWLHYYMQGHFFMPFLQMVQGIVMMAICGVLVARFWGARRLLDIALVASILCVFPYMAQVYQYNTTMATYSLAHLLAAAAVIVSVRQGVAAVLAGAALYLAAFSIYQGVAANAVTILLVWALMRLLFPAEAQMFWSRATARSLATALVALFAGGAAYLAAVSMMTIEFDAYQSAEKAFKPGAGIDLKHSIPLILNGTRASLLWPETYFPGVLKKAQLLLLMAAGLACLFKPRTWWARGAALLLLLAACLAPRSLQVLHAEGHFHELTLTGYALLVAASVLVVLRSAPMLVRNGAALLASALVAAYLLQCNWISTVNHLNTQAHFSTLTQILARVRSLPATDWDGKTIAVVGELDMKEGYPFKRATGVASEFMRARHMDKLARLMRDDAAIVAADEKMPGVLAFAAGRAPWPHPASVGVVDGVGVVVLGKPR